MQYRPRVIDSELDDLLTGLPAIVLEGPKAVGKTATAIRRAGTVHALDDDNQLQVLAADPTRLTAGRTPILIDEWQRLPSSWDVVRRAVDRDRTPGRFLLTGSAAPVEAPTHSGAGRLVSVRMRPLSLAERYPATGTVSLRRLLDGDRAPLAGTTDLRLADYADEIVRSGFPAIRELDGRALRSQIDGYLSRIVERDFEELGHRVRDPAALRRWMAAYGAVSSTPASLELIRDASSAGEGDKPARSTTIPYRSALERLWMIDDVPAWLPSRNHIRRLAAAPIRQLADPAFAAHLLGVGVEALLDAADAGPPVPRDGALLGALFQSLVTQSVQVYAQAAEARVAHLRTSAGDHEVDLVVERLDGRVVALEVKLAQMVRDEDLKHLTWLKERIGDDLLDAVVVTTGTEAFRRRDGIGVVPAGLLMP